MNLYAFFNRGTVLSGVNARKEKELTAQRDSAVATARAKWRNALLVDETRAWMAIGQQDSSAVLNGLVVVLGLAAAAKSFDDGHEDSPTVRIIRGAISAAKQCAASANCVIRAVDAKAFQSAAKVAGEAIASCSTQAIFNAALFLQRTTGTPI